MDKDILKPLVDQTLELASHPSMEQRKELWANHQTLGKTDKIPVCVWYEFIPEPQWKLILGHDSLHCSSQAARDIEWSLKKRLWAARNIPDDHIVWPSLIILAVLSKEVSWGVDFKMAGTDAHVENPLEAKIFVPAFPEGIETERVRFSDMVIDQESTEVSIQRTRELTEDRLQIAVSYPDLGYSPFDMAVKMRGLENLMYDVMDAPERVLGLMERITAGFEDHHRNREERGWINVVMSRHGRYAQVGFRVHCVYPSPDFDPEKPRLQDEWAYVSAQTSSGLGPEMYEEFVHPYNVRLARLFPRGTVYYHGCECLDQKLDLLSTLPNLRRLHVSPWSSLKKAREKFDGKVVLEVHAHPGKVFFGYTRDDMRVEIERLVGEAEGVPIDLNLSDIHSVNGNPDLLRQWAEAVQQVSRRR